MSLISIVLVSYLLTWNLAASGVLWNFAHDLIQWNLVGIPDVHKKTTWDFDPDAGIKMKDVYEQSNGKLGEKAIARIGLGFES